MHAGLYYLFHITFVSSNEHLREYFSGFGHYIKGEAVLYSDSDAHFFSLKRKPILLSSFTFILNMLQHVICRQSKEATHNKTTYKLSTATSVTSFIDTFFCSIIWTISPVGKKT